MIMPQIEVYRDANNYGVIIDGPNISSLLKKYIYALSESIFIGAPLNERVLYEIKYHCINILNSMIQSGEIWYNPFKNIYEECCKIHDVSCEEHYRHYLGEWKKK